MSLHKDLTGADLHEPKGIGSATSGQVYKADGAGSGSWQTQVIPTGLFNVTVAAFTSSGTWTKPTGCYMIKVTVLGGGGGSTGAGGGSSFATAVTATGGAIGGGVSAAGGVGASGDLNLTGDSQFSFDAHASAESGLKIGIYGTGGAGDGVAGVGGGGGGASIKYIYSVPSTATVTVGAGGTGTRPGNPGLVLVEQYVSI